MKTKRFWKRTILFGIFGLLGVCVVLAGVSALLNQSLPRRSVVVNRLSEEQKATLAEAMHLRQTLGDEVWPGWSEVQIPFAVYNEGYAFLVGLSNPAPGWVMVPRGEARGAEWELVPDDLFRGQPYYRQRLKNAEKTPENFTVKVGEYWAASLMTREYSLISFATGFRKELPPVIRDVFPYRLAWSFLMGNRERYISGLNHEAFHAFEGMHAEQRMDAAERAAPLEGSYPWEDGALKEAWKQELDLLSRAAKAESEADARSLAVQFLAQREQRRAMPGMTAQLVEYERQREWLEGLAKYAELELSLQAALSDDYRPLPQMEGGSEFNNYQGEKRFFNTQLDEVRRMTNHQGEVRFYYSGFAQAVLLDRFQPDWKMQAMDDGVFLEDLLRAALK